MFKKIFSLLVFINLFLFTAPNALANESFVNVVNPIRGKDFWEIKGQEVETVVQGQIGILGQYNVTATWLIRPDALENSKTQDLLKERSSDEKGLFLEITPTLTQKANVKYRKSKDWYAPGSAFLTGYDQTERLKLIDAAFESFKEAFGFFPKSVGAWWIDAYSLSYMQEKYEIAGALIVADQYSTDNYQIWGQYWGIPYYPAIRNSLIPAQEISQKIPVVIMQWAARDPINGYGKGVEESTYSVQPNDYIDYHNLGIDYFSALIDIYTKPQFNQFGQIVVGLENTYSWEKYKEEYENQIKLLSERSKKGQFSLVTMTDFSNWYRKTFPDISPNYIIVSNDPLKTAKKSIWFMNPFYRVGWFYTSPGSAVYDIRQYIEGSEEICYLRGCEKLNFATYTTRVLDHVTYGHKWLLDDGTIKDFQVFQNNENYTFSYTNEAGAKREIAFLPKDISVDKKQFTIDGAILENSHQLSLVDDKITNPFSDTGIKQFLTGKMILSFILFTLFINFIFLIPGLVIIDQSLKETSVYLKIFLSIPVGISLFTLLSYLFELGNVSWLIYLYLFVGLILFIRNKTFNLFKELKVNLNGLNILIVLVVLFGTIFQVIPTFRSGHTYKEGMGFWGPNGHDGVWHIALVNQLLKDVPPENPIFADTKLKNYHFFYDLLISKTSFISQIPVNDLIFKLYPILFSLLVGVGGYHLFLNLFNAYPEKQLKLGTVFALILIYFAGSFGWIIEYFKNRSLGGESNFWVNQSISFNLNPPFAISLILIIAIFNLLFYLEKQRNRNIPLSLILIILCGSLVGFKAYGAILIFATLIPFWLKGLLKDKKVDLLMIFVGSLILAVSIFLLNYRSKDLLIGGPGSLFIFAPFWFIHSMIDSPDRVGWTRISLMRMVGYETNNLLKIITSEMISFVLFITGNLGTRVFGLATFLKLKLHKNFLFSFITFFTLISLFIPTLFIQTGNPWNTIQFMYYGLFIFSLLGGFAVSMFLLRLPKSLAILIGLFILLITPINSMKTASGYFISTPHAYISAAELEGLDFISKKEKGVILIYPFEKNLREKYGQPIPLFAYDTSSYVSAMAKNPTFLSDISQNEILQTNYPKRLVVNKDFFRYLNSTDEYPENITKLEEILKQNNIRYLYLLKEYKIKINTDKLNIKKIFENDAVEVYERSLS